ncbi:aminotransferase class I/II-fold pyridoxal phosphate-dependent enzyme [Gordonia sp. HNM0687]|uniref:Serine hydroxymethyltransferase n=1 Tax=Gordonia mangrovi TaxID=2665643 RepID=A0A6L7GX52_9ACTN|nr:serine hydroxymethyltransferase [Gordonia mangrovi]MXP23195.1 aminotransferase class I/II-fold pyridoxal phosphate-dependent enzyme [Gordonia mangrovi]UVF77469.1 serine hydroxymethyltransferase [Gordonia mangrovi]
MPGPLSDPQVADLLDRETRRRDTTLQLLASETPASAAVRATLTSDLGTKYAEGYPGARYHGGCEVADEVENLAIGRAAELFGADYVNVQPLSGSVAGLAVYAAFAQPGDPILALGLRHGGHQTHGSRANFSGRWFAPIHYGVRRSDERVDYAELRDLALLHRPRIIVVGGAAYARSFDFAALRTIADEAEAILWVDAAHLAGLVAGGVIDSPVPHADVVTLATHKVLQGPRGGMILARAEHRAVLQKAVHPFVQGGPSMHSIAAKAVCMREARTAAFAAYASDAVAAAQRLGAELAGHGLRIVSGDTDLHFAVVDVSGLGMSGAQAQRRLDSAGIVVDRSVIPFDSRPVSEGSAIRFGTPCAVLAGLGPTAMPDVADWMVRALAAEAGATQHADIRREIRLRLGG